jgi:hypothetical protein
MKDVSRTNGKTLYPAGAFPYFANFDLTRPSASLYGTGSLGVFGTWRMPLFSVPLMGDATLTSMRSFLQVGEKMRCIEMSGRRWGFGNRFVSSKVVRRPFEDII